MKRISCAWGLALLFACGGGGGSESPSAVAGETVGSLRITFLDGNTGWLLETPAGRVYVIDPGEVATYENELRPLLLQRGITTIDGVLITHPHSDHYNGLRYWDDGWKGLLEEFVVQKLYDSAGLWNDETSAYYSKIVSAAEKKGIPRASGLHQGDLLDWDPQLAVEVVGLPSPYFSREECEAWNGYDTVANWTNENSIVLQVSHGKARFLFTGDIHEVGMAYLLGQYPSRPNPKPVSGIHVLTVPHHGVGRTGYSSFRDAVKAKVTISPHDERASSWGVNWWDTQESDLYWSQVEGTVTITSEGAGFRVTTEQGSEQEYPITLRATLVAA